MFVYFGSQKPESRDRARQNYNYLVTFSYSCLHYNGGNRFPGFPIGLNWDGVSRNPLHRRAASALLEKGSGHDGADPAYLADLPTGCRLCTSQFATGARVSRPYDARVCGGGLLTALNSDMSSVIIDEE